MPALKTVLLCFCAWVGSALLTLAVLAGAFTPSHPARKPQVAFSEFLAEVEAGHVEEIRVAGRVATFRRRDGGNTTERQTIGPFGDHAQVLALRPTALDLPAPKVTFE